MLLFLHTKIRRPVLFLINIFEVVNENSISIEDARKKIWGNVMTSRACFQMKSNFTQGKPLHYSFIEIHKKNDDGIHDNFFGLNTEL